jgi:D-3-phosphoglycerate dehydrogenase / 2-oxoglutarate reductase
MLKILANDGIHPKGAAMLENAGIAVDNQRIEQSELPSRLQIYDGLIVRSATKVRKELIDACPNLKIIGRGGVGMDNIDVSYARDKGIKVVNTPFASSRSVAELVMAHMMSIGRGLYDSNRRMSESGHKDFKALKKSYSNGLEVEGKKLAIIGFGRIGQELAKIALGLGMDVYPVDPFVSNVTLDLNIARVHEIKVPLHSVELERALAVADYISLHVPKMENGPLIGEKEFDLMKKRAIIVNTSRGGVIDEQALIQALDNDQIRGAGLDVFVGEPTPNQKLLRHPKISLSPHIGASTEEAQEKIGVELAELVIKHFGK